MSAMDLSLGSSKSRDWDKELRASSLVARWYLEAEVRESQKWDRAERKSSEGCVNELITSEKTGVSICLGTFLEMV